mmetsp:Transcript_95689/g.298955  ORF Transcript_95689/g.298955 Transcript_95689/m.298955 type:complete len:254 (-) Transcript_95689:340-1101(-)
MVTLGEDPGVEVRRDVLAHVHLGPLLVVLHLLVVHLHALLEGDGVLVVPRLDVLGDAAVGAVGAHNDIHLQGLLGALPCIAVLLGEVVVGQHIRVLLPLRQSHAHEQAIDDRRAIFSGPVSQEGVEDLTAEHADELVVLQRPADLHLLVRWGDHRHLAHLAVDDALGQVELVEHAERDGSAAGLAIVQLSLDEVGLNARACESVGTAGSAWAATHDRHAQLPAFRQLGARTDDDLCTAEGRLLRSHDGGHART